MPKSKSICSFCFKDILKKETYTVNVKSIGFDMIYKTICCNSCLDNDRIINTVSKPKLNKSKS